MGGTASGVSLFPFVGFGFCSSHLVACAPIVVPITLALVSRVTYAVETDVLIRIEVAVGVRPLPRLSCLVELVLRISSPFHAFPVGQRVLVVEAA
jgi:hypothetical protein